METLFEIKQKTDFEIFDEENPHVWKQFERMALDLINAGVKHFGAKAIWENLRFHFITTTSDPEYKLNNNYTADYARKFIKKHPEHKNFFETRIRKNGNGNSYRRL